MRPPASIPASSVKGSVVPHLAYVAPRMVQFDVPLDAMRRGYNTIDLSLAEGQAQKITWMEVFIAPGASGRVSDGARTSR